MKLQLNSSLIFTSSFDVSIFRRVLVEKKNQSHPQVITRALDINAEIVEFRLVTY